ncbi:hypothetical protein A9404_02040 [Halothiobacillus diazotrophicus]|uniref:Uncharacterized protein n=1 Tax=Halothiobacillus diazotrophicus TaxID=1860122 RepID=A0A191ZEN4_9GAMM|nr:hypothetical protein A9404_02040 [Halothiobacillus diazotrophicus]
MSGASLFIGFVCCIEDRVHSIPDTSFADEQADRARCSDTSKIGQMAGFQDVFVQALKSVL